MLALLAALAAFILTPSQVDASGLCGRPTAPNIRLGMLAYMASQKCAGIDEIDDAMLGRLARLDGVNPKSRACEMDVATLLKEMTSSYDADGVSWCGTARRVLSEHPALRHLVRPPEEADCTELDKVSAMVETAATTCAFRITEAGASMRAMAKSTPVCIAKFQREHEAHIALRQKLLKGDRAKATAFWCRQFQAEHRDQFQSVGMKVLFEPVSSSR